MASERQRPHRVLLKRAGWSLLVLALLAGLIEIAIYHYDPTRVIYKRLKAPDPYLYEEIDPKLRETDVASLIRPDAIRDRELTRQKLIDVVWGPAGYPDGPEPDKVQPSVSDNVLGRLPEGTLVSKLYFDLGLGLSSWPYFARSAEGNNRLVIYHHGFGDPIDRVSGFLNDLLNAGYDVLAFNALGHGGTLAFVDSDQDGIREHARQSGKSNIFHEMSHFERPLKYHLDPLVGALTYVQARHSYRSIDIVGFSMGGFMAVLAAAVIPEIERSYPIAGVYPNYMRRGQEVFPDGPPAYGPLIDTANHLELFVLGASGAGRAQLQIFNRYDRCCFNGIRSQLFKAEVQRTVAQAGHGGRFDVLIDESHADHRISDFAKRAILKDLDRDR